MLKIVCRGAWVVCYFWWIFEMLFQLVIIHNRLHAEEKFVMNFFSLNLTRAKHFISVFLRLQMNVKCRWRRFKMSRRSHTNMYNKQQRGANLCCDGMSTSHHWKSTYLQSIGEADKMGGRLCETINVMSILKLVKELEKCIQITQLLICVPAGGRSKPCHFFPLLFFFFKISILTRVGCYATLCVYIRVIIVI